MKIDILTLFPSMFDGFLSNSIIKRAIAMEKVQIQIVNIRDYSRDPHKKVDDYGFGGGAGMVLRVDVLYDAIQALKKEDTKVILMTPQGETFTQKKAAVLAQCKHIILVCGHYEGFDERILNFVDMEISIGDFIVTGGEIPAMAITDSMVRLLDGVILEESRRNESFENHLLDYPVYTKPKEFMGYFVPEVLLSGNHAEIEKFRQQQRIEKTRRKRPDLLENGGGYDGEANL
jgi:tRNA (guanine37-N1)-methyltransferase